MGLVQCAVNFVGWKWLAPWVFQVSDGQQVNILEVAGPLWEHVDALRKALWVQAAKRRDDMEGIQQGIDREVTQAFYTVSGWASMSKVCYITFSVVRCGPKITVSERI